MLNRKLDSIKVEKDIAISMTKEIGIKIAQVIKLNFDSNSKISDMGSVERERKILSDIENVEVVEAFEIEKER